MKISVKKPNRKYESIIIAHPETSDQDMKAFFTKNKKIIENFQGHLSHLHTWGKRRLANPIKKVKVGTYFHILFEANSDCIEELERTTRIDNKILRFYYQKLDDRISLDKYLENYKDVIAESTKREQEKEAKIKARKEMRKQV